MRRAPSEAGSALAGLPRRRLLVMGALSTFAPLSIDLYLPALPELARQLHASDSAAQWSVSMCLIGLATGQLCIGPLSDRLGRKRPLFVGVIIYTVASVACATAPSMGALIGLRLLQGVAGSSGMVIVQAMVRDLYEGRQMARMLSLLMLIGGAAPIVAPLLGGQLLLVMDWRGLFVVLAAISGLLLLAVSTLPETLPEGRRHGGGMRRVGTGFADLVRDRVFVGCMLGGGVGGASFMVYISVSAFVLEGGYGVSAQEFSLIFGMNSVGLMLGGYLNARLLRRYGPEALLLGGAMVAAVASLLMVTAALLDAPLALFLPTLFITVSTGGLVRPNATALALTRHPANAGAAAAVLGSSGFLLGGLLAPLASARGANAITMAASMSSARLVAWFAYAFVARPHRLQTTEGTTANLPSENTERR